MGWNFRKVRRPNRSNNFRLISRDIINLFSLHNHSRLLIIWPLGINNHLNHLYFHSILRKILRISQEMIIFLSLRKHKLVITWNQIAPRKIRTTQMDKNAFHNRIDKVRKIAWHSISRMISRRTNNFCLIQKQY